MVKTTNCIRCGSERVELLRKERVWVEEVERECLKWFCHNCLSPFITDLDGKPLEDSDDKQYA